MTQIFRGSNFVFTNNSGDDEILLTAGIGETLNFPNISSNNQFGLLTATSTAQVLLNTVSSLLVGYWDSIPILTGTVPLTYSNGLFTITQNGTYICGYSCGILTGNGERVSNLIVDGTILKAINVQIRNTASGNFMTGSSVLQLNIGSTVGVNVIQNSGGNLNTSSLYQGGFYIYRIG